MLVLEFKAYAKPNQFQSIDEAIRICQFIRNKSIRLWIDGGLTLSGLKPLRFLFLRIDLPI